MSPVSPYPRTEGEDPGVPEALGRALSELVGQVGAEALDVLWIFPPLRKGRREHGVLAAGCGAAGSGLEEDRRTLVTLAWTAEETGKGVAFETRFTEEGEAPPDRLPRIMEGVVRRAREHPGPARRIEVGGDPEQLRVLLARLGVTDTPHGAPGGGASPSEPDIPTPETRP